MDAAEQMECLVLRCQVGDHEAFEEVFRQFQPRIEYYVRRLTSEQGVEDLLQEIWLKVIRKIGTLKHPQAFVSWIYRIARNELYGRGRQALPETTPYEEGQLATEDEPDAWLLAAEDAERIHRGLNHIKSHHPEIRVIEPGAILKTRYRLDTAIATKEVMGLDFAVHEVQRCKGNLIVTCSVRPTEESLRQIDAAGLERNQHSSQEYGRFQMGSFWQRKPNGEIESRHYSQEDLGSVVQDGVHYRWYAMRPTAPWPGFENRLEVCGYVYTANALAELRKQQGLEWYKNIRPILTIDLPEQEIPLDALSDDLHSIQRQVTGRRWQLRSLACSW